MMNRPKKFRAIISKITNQINNILSEINSQIKKQQTLFAHAITIKLNSEKKTLIFFLNSNFVPSSEIKTDSIYFQDILKQLNEIVNKIHFFNYHIRIIIMEEKSSMTYLELQSQSLTLPNFPQIVQNFSNFYEKKLDKDNILMKKFEYKTEEYEIELDLCYIFHNLAKFGTFDLLLFNNRLYDLNLSKDDMLLNELKSQMDFIKSLIEEVYEKIKLFVENKQMVFYFNIISGCLKDIYTSTADQELYDTFNTLFEPCNNDPKYLQKKLTKNFMLCSNK